MRFVYELPESIRYSLDRIQIVPIAGTEGERRFVFAFEVHDFIHPDTGAPGGDETQVVATLTSSDFSGSHTLVQTEWQDRARLLAAVPVEETNRCVLLGSDWRFNIRSRRAIHRYWIIDALSEESRDNPTLFLKQRWTGRVNNASYKPLTAGGKIVSGSDFVVIAIRTLNVAPDDFEVALVALRVDSSTLTVTSELELTSQTIPLSAPNPFSKAVITPVSAGRGDGWVVAYQAGLEVIGINIEPGVGRKLGPEVIYDGTRITSMDSVQIAGSTYAPPGAYIRRRATYMLAFSATRDERREPSESPLPHPGARETAGVTFDWVERSPIEIQPKGEVWYGPSPGLPSLASDTKTKSHWLLLDSGATATPYVSESPGHIPGLVRRFSRVGFTAAAFKQYHVTDPGLRAAAIAFDHRSNFGIVAGHAFNEEHHGLHVRRLRQRGPLVAAVPWEGDCPQMVASSDSELIRGRPFAGHRFFTVDLIGGPPNEDAELWVGVAFRRRTEDPCEWAIDLTDRATTRIHHAARTNEAGYVSRELPISDRLLDDIFDRFSESFRLRGAFEDYPRILISQWRWPSVSDSRMSDPS